MPKANAIENSYMLANGPWPVTSDRSTRLASRKIVASQARMDA